MATVKRELTVNFTSEEAIHHNKISVTGTGSVGMACAISILLKKMCIELLCASQADANPRMSGDINLCQDRIVGPIPGGFDAAEMSSCVEWSEHCWDPVPLKDLSADTGTAKDPEQPEAVHGEVVASGYEMLKTKG